MPILLNYPYTNVICLVNFNLFEIRKYIGRLYL